MNLIILAVIGLAVAAAAGAWWWWPARAARSAPVLPVVASPAAAAARQRAMTPRAVPPVEPPPPEVPARLAEFRPVAPGDLADDRRAALSAELRAIPRPPPALRQLTSPAFLESASSAELSDLIMVEGRVAAKMLATVNSPFYGLRQPVTSVGQAVTFLGLNTVRSLCVQALLEASFNVGQPALRQQFDAIGRASAFASELCGRLVAMLGLPAQGTLATQVVLSFLGPMASAALMADKPGAPTLSDELLARSIAEQAQIGLGAAALGGLLLQLWELPAAIVDEVVAIDGILVTPAGPNDPPQVLHRALCYLCARLGERLANGSLASLAEFDPMTDDSEDFFHLRGHLRKPALARLTESLHSADLGHALTALARGSAR